MLLHLTLVGLFRAWKFEKQAHFRVSAYGSVLSYLNLVVYQGWSTLLRIFDGLLSTGNCIKTALWLTQNKSNNRDILQLTIRGHAGQLANLQSWWGYLCNGIVKRIWKAAASLILSHSFWTPVSLFFRHHFSSLNRTVTCEFFQDSFEDFMFAIGHRFSRRWFLSTRPWLPAPFGELLPSPSVLTLPLSGKSVSSW